jgi:hypothetical protein
MSKRSRQWLYLVFAVALLISALPMARTAHAQTGPTATPVPTFQGLFELTGVIEDIQIGVVTINKLKIDVRTASVGTPLKVGVVVKVEGFVSATGLVARQITQPDATAKGGEAEIVGTLERNDNNMMIIGGQTVDATRAEIKAGVTVGQLVKAEGTLTATGLLAREVKPVTATTLRDRDQIRERDRERGELEITGKVDQVGADFIVVNGQRINLDAAEIKDKLTVGATVKVHLQFVGGVLVAREVEDVARARERSGSNSGKGSDDSGSDDHGGSGDPVMIMVGVETPAAAATINPVPA